MARSISYSLGAIALVTMSSVANAFDFASFLGFGAAITPTPPPVVVTQSVQGTQPLGQPWRIVKTSWSPADEKSFSDFVQRIGEAPCYTLDSCLKSSANPYRATDPAEVTFTSDCADLPYALRSYFAYKNGLPFVFASEIAPVGESHDDRYSPNGNRVVSNGRAKTGILNAYQFIRDLEDDTSSANYRISPMTDATDDVFSEFYSPKIQLGSIRPGTVVYDPNGHVAMVYKIEDDGRIRVMDSHPDNSLTHGTYGNRFVRTNPAVGAGFKNFRPITLIGATQDTSGAYIGGKIRAARNAELSDFGLEQYVGTQPSSESWTKGKFTVNGQEWPYYDYVRLKMAAGNLSFDPVVETTNLINDLCQDLSYRPNSVNQAIKAGINLKDHPERLPNNIYGTDGEWEIYASPSVDARLKGSFKELRDRVAGFLMMNAKHDPRIKYNGRNLRADLLEVYQKTTESPTCEITYTRTDGSQVFDLSFDPYMCPELRWGASGDELATCQDSQEKLDWYKAEARLRAQIERTYNVNMAFSVADLVARVPGSGTDKIPDVDVKKLLMTNTQFGEIRHGSR